MANSIAFTSWLLQPGNHRQLRTIRNTLQPLLKRKLEFSSWADVYTVFEESVEASDDNREIFDPVFAECPPCEELGATPKQIGLYRGATYNPEALPIAKAETITVTYRGQVIEKRRVALSTSECDGVDSTIKADAPRYYRGARVN